jgi:hypothetical protein
VPFTLPFSPSSPLLSILHPSAVPSSVLWLFANIDSLHLPWLAVLLRELVQPIDAALLLVMLAGRRMLLFGSRLLPQLTTVSLVVALGASMIQSGFLVLFCKPPHNELPLVET